MNIQRYALPMIVAAGFHSALFLITPEPSTVTEKTVDKIQLPPMPETEKILEITEVSEVSSEKSGGGPALPVLCDVVVALPEKSQFQIPKTDTPIENHLIATDLRSAISPGDGNPGPISGERIFYRPDSLDRHPRATAQMSPDYPAPLHQQGISGSVTVEFDVDTIGRVIRVEAVNYTRREFVEPALRAVRNWRFEPGKRNGKAVPFRMAVPIQFSIDA